MSQSSSPVAPPRLPAMLRGYHGFHTRPSGDESMVVCFLATQNGEAAVRSTLESIGILDALHEDHLLWADTGYEFRVHVSRQEQVNQALHDLHD